MLQLPYQDCKNKAPDQVLYDSFKKALGDIRLEIPFANAIKVPTYSKFLCDILSRKKEITKTIAMVTSYTANGKLLSKSGDPRIPTISCSIGKTDIHNALCDLGAGVSVMSYSLYKRLGLGEYSPTTITL